MVSNYSLQVFQNFQLAPIYFIEAVIIFLGLLLEKQFVLQILFYEM